MSQRGYFRTVGLIVSGLWAMYQMGLESKDHSYQSKLHENKETKPKKILLKGAPNVT